MNLPLIREIRNHLVGRVRSVCNEQGTVSRDPFALAKELGVHARRIGELQAEGVHVGNQILINDKGALERQAFTAYHEIMHYLIRCDDELYSMLEELSLTDRELNDVKEWLANIGAAEFLIPSRELGELCRREGYSIFFLPQICERWECSAPAAMIQLVSLCPSRLLALSCEQRITDTAGLFPLSTRSLVVDMWACSPSMKCSVRKGAPIPAGHIIHRSLLSGERCEGRDYIPLVSGKKWQVDVECLPYRSRIYSAFSPDGFKSKSVSLNQSRLFELGDGESTTY